MSTDRITRPREVDTSGVPTVVTSRAQLRAARDAMSGRVGVVMTMGALHEGHLALLRAARRSCDQVLVTIFVNPLQFGPAEDLDRYPRTLDADVRCCAAEGVDVVFAPSVSVMYPAGEPRVRINPGPLGQILEGAARPGFFDGVLTVVDKLIGLTRPHAVFFGEKDYQQLILVRSMVRDLELHTDGAPVGVVAVPTARERTGLARSSRNVYLSDEQRRVASGLSAALAAGAAAAERGPAAALAAVRGALADGPRPDYLVVTDPELGPAPERGDGRLLLAARVGDTRLIDNMPVRLGPAQG